MSDCMDPICGMDNYKCSSCRKDEIIMELEATVAALTVARDSLKSNQAALITELREMAEKWCNPEWYGDKIHHHAFCADELTALLEKETSNE